MNVKITVEGPTGTGKPVIIKELREFLETGGSDFLRAIIEDKNLTFDFIEKLP